MRICFIVTQVGCNIDNIALLRMDFNVNVLRKSFREVHDSAEFMFRWAHVSR